MLLTTDVIGCRLTQETTVENALDDVASNICQEVLLELNGMLWRGEKCVGGRTMRSTWLASAQLVMTRSARPQYGPAPGSLTQNKHSTEIRA
jgi:hypothetical protein